MKEETRKKLSEKARIQWQNPEFRKYMRIRNSGKNNYMFGRKHTPEAIEKIRLEKKNRVVKKSTKEKLSVINKGNQNAKGRIWTEESKKKLNESQKKIKRDVNGNKNPFYGKTHTDEIKRKISEFHKGKPSWNKGIKGKESHIYVDGTGYLPYDDKFNKELKKKILKRDDYKCQNCGNKKGLEVHHIDSNKQNSVSENLITLCRSCHSKTKRKKIET